MVFNAFFHYSRCRSLTHAFLWMTLGFYLLILPPLDIFFLWGIFCLLMGCSSMWGSGMREKSSYSILENLILFILYPVFIILAPVVIIIMKLRFIFSNNEALFWQKLILAKAESSLESYPQLILQLYIVFTRFDRTPSTMQILVILSSIIAISITTIDEFLSTKKLSGLMNILIYFPYFFLLWGVGVIEVSIYAALCHENGYSIFSSILTFWLIIVHSVAFVSLCKSGAPINVKNLLYHVGKISNTLSTLIKCLITIAIILIINIAPNMHINGDTYLGWDKLPIFVYVNTILSCILAGQILVPVVRFSYNHFGYEINNVNILFIE